MSRIIDERVRLIADDRLHGAGWLARQAVEALAEAVEEGADPLESGRALAAARPSIGAIAGAVGRVLAAGRTDDHLLEQSRALLERRDHADRTIAVLVGPLMNGVVMTHSASATVREALLHGEPERVVCTVSSPVEEGRPFAADLTAQGLAVDLVADEDAAHAVATANLLLLGADTVFADGSLVNKAGTAHLAAAARSADVPVVVAFETFKLAPYQSAEEALESWGGGGELEDIFDVSPAKSINSYATDEGMFEPDEIAALVDRTPYLREGYELLRSGAR
jgi:translation initiation factor 2B subunit (eIF-2B alpha/beta/delta family)